MRFLIELALKSQVRSTRNIYRHLSLSFIALGYAFMAGRSVFFVCFWDSGGLFFRKLIPCVHLLNRKLEVAFKLACLIHGAAVEPVRVDVVRVHGQGRAKQADD